MFTSDKTLIAHIRGNIIAAVLLALFGGVYEYFSYEVYSYFMIYAFAFPLVMGALVYSFLIFRKRIPDRRALILWNSAIAAFAVGSGFQGVLDIYGTTNRLIIVYPITGSVMAVLALIFFFSKNKT